MIRDQNTFKTILLIISTQYIFFYQNINVCNEKKILTKNESLITDVVTVHNTDGALKSTENHKHTNEIKGKY